MSEILKRNEHLYPVSIEFQLWWMEQTTEPYRVCFEKLFAWKAWELKQKEIDDLKKELVKRCVLSDVF